MEGALLWEVQRKSRVLTTKDSFSLVQGSVGRDSHETVAKPTSEPQLPLPHLVHLPPGSL